MSVVVHGLLWGPLVWIAHDPLPPVTHEIAVELVPSDKLEELTKAQEPAKPEVQDIAMDQKVEPQPSPSPQGQDQTQPNQQAPHYDVQPPPPAQPAQAQTAHAAQPAQPSETL